MPELAESNPFDPAILESPWDYNRQLRAEAPVYRDPNTGLFLISSYEHVLDALKDHVTFSNRFAPAMGGQGGPFGNAEGDPALAERKARSYPIVDTMLTADPPEQKRFRGLVNKAFTNRRIEQLSPYVEALADELIDTFARDGRFEVLSQFAVPLPLTVIADQLGVPRADLPKFKRWTDGFTAQLSGMASAEGQREAVERILEYQEYFAAKLEACAKDPRDDIISDLVRARIDGERPLDIGESLSIIQQLLVAGNETTAATIAEGLLLFVSNPEQLALVKADPDLIPNMVEEVLRLTTPTANMWRRVTADTELGGVKIPEGSMALVRFASANRDEKVFPNADRFDVRRANASEQLAFGHGVHFCVGAQLARKELTTAFRRLLSRLEGLRLAPDQELHHKPNILLRGLAELHLEFEGVQ